jgi:hypothetical protein
MDINDKLKDYVPYEQMSDYEKRQVDMLVEQYKNGSLNSDYSGISHNDVDRFINTRLNLEEMNRINDKIIEGEKSKNFEANEMRYQLFEDRWKKGFYGNDRREIPGKDESSEVKQLKDEVRSLKGDINELKELLKQKLT